MRQVLINKSVGPSFCLNFYCTNEAAHNNSVLPYQCVNKCEVTRQFVTVVKATQKKPSVSNLELPMLGFINA